MNAVLLEDRLRALMEGRAAKVVYLRADEGLRYGRVIAVVDKIKKAGVDQIGFAYVLPQEKAAEVNDPVDTVLAQREALDRGFSGSLLVSGLVHGALVGAALLAAFLAPQEPLIKIADGFAVPLPRGGGGNPNPAPAAPRQARSPRRPSPPRRRSPSRRRSSSRPPRSARACPSSTSKKAPKKPEPTRPAPRTASTAPGAPAPPGTARTSGPGGTGTSNQPLGLEMLPDGPGVPGGADGGDYYMAGVQRKIWTIWMQQVKRRFASP